MRQKAFSLGDKVKISISGETGKVVGVAEYLYSQDQFYVHYKAADGRAVEAWWSGELLEEVDPEDGEG